MFLKLGDSSQCFIVLDIDTVTYSLSVTEAILVLENKYDPRDFSRRHLNNKLCFSPSSSSLIPIVYEAIIKQNSNTVSSKCGATLPQHG